MTPTGRSSNVETLWSAKIPSARLLTVKRPPFPGRTRGASPPITGLDFDGAAEAVEGGACAPPVTLLLQTAPAVAVMTSPFLAGMPGPQQTWMQCGDNTYRGIAITDSRFVFLCGDILATI